MPQGKARATVTHPLLNLHPLKRPAPPCAQNGKKQVKVGHSKVESTKVSVWSPTSQKLRGNWSSDFLPRVTAPGLGPQCWLPAAQPCALPCTQGCVPLPRVNAVWKNVLASQLLDRHPSLEQMAVSTTRKPQKLSHGGRLGFMPGKVIPHLAKSKPARLFWPRLRHRSVSSESPLRLPFPVGSVFQVVPGGSMRSKCHLPSFRCLTWEGGL